MVLLTSIGPASRDTWSQPETWNLAIYHNGSAVFSGGQRGTRRFVVAPSRMAELREEIAAADLDNLSPTHYGTRVANARICGLNVAGAGLNWQFSLSPFQDTPPTPAERRAVRQVLRVWSTTKKAADMLGLPDACTNMLAEKGPSNKELDRTKDAPSR